MGDPKGRHGSSAEARAGLALGALAVAAALAVYWPIPRMFFFADDLCALCYLASEGFVSFVLEPFGSHMLHARNLATWALYQVAGFDPWPFYASVLLVHLINVALLFVCLRLWTDSAILACFGAVLWGTSPLARGTLTWYAASGQALAATFALVVLASVARHDVRMTPVTVRTVAIWSILLLVGATCFGTGIAVAVVFPVLALLVLPRALWRPGARFALIVLPIAVAVLQATAPDLHQLASGRAQSYHQRVWDLRGLLTPSRAQELVRFLSALLARGWVVLSGGWLRPVIGSEPTPWWGAGAVLLGGVATAAGLLFGGSALRRRLDGRPRRGDLRPDRARSRLLLDAQVARGLRHHRALSPARGDPARRDRLPLAGAARPRAACAANTRGRPARRLARPVRRRLLAERLSHRHPRRAAPGRREGVPDARREHRRDARGWRGDPGERGSARGCHPRSHHALRDPAGVCGPAARARGIGRRPRPSCPLRRAGPGTVGRHPALLPRPDA